MFVSAKGGQGPGAEEVWRESMSQIKKNWIRGPRRYTPKGELWVGGKPIAADPDFRSGAQQVDKLRAVHDPKGSSTNEATFAKTPINLS